VEIEVREPAVKHTVTLAQLQRWANGATSSPVEKIKWERMRGLLEAKPLLFACDEGSTLSNHSPDRSRAKASRLIEMNILD
jgi:hypothetical protein